MPFSYTQAQKEDNVWAFGYRYSFDTISNRIYLNFNDSLQISYEQRPMTFFSTSASICDSSGNLLIYSNGCYVESANGVEVQNSEGLNPGALYNNCEDNQGYNIAQNMILLPDPIESSIYHLFHLPSDITPQIGLFYAIMHSKFDMSANGGNGTTLFKNKILVSDTIHYDGLHALRHANGRDWWMMAAKRNSNKYYILLFSPHGIAINEQTIGVPTSTTAQGEIVFSPNGTKVARFNGQDDLRIFDFDRCTGTLSNPIFIPIQDNSDIEIFAGLAWSADSRYLYAAEIWRILQFDTWVTDIAASKVEIAQLDLDIQCPFTTEFGFMELGPDGRIYCRPLNGQNCMHRINHPERPGLECEAQPNHFNFDFPYKNMPHFPNFRLGPVDGSPCDTLGLDNHPLAGWRYDRTGGLDVDFTSVSWYEPTEWWWDFGDPASGTANTSTEKHPSHTFSAPGGYEVCLTVSNQYGSDTKCKMVWVVTSSTSSGSGQEEAVKVYPNPTTGEIRWEGLEQEEVTLRVYDALGRLCLQQTTSESRADLDGLPEGLYCWQIVTEGKKVYAGKIDKQ